MQLDFTFSAPRLETVRHGAGYILDTPAVFQVEGPAALECLQGLLTSDLAAPGDDSLGYGAMLTGKGMVVLDPFVLRHGGRFILLVPGFIREAALAHLARMLPPRLARMQDRSEGWGGLWLLGPRSLDLLAGLGATPPPGSGRVIGWDGEGTLLATGLPSMPFAALLVGPVPRLRHWGAQCERVGMDRGDESWLAAARVLAGWPTLGREIDERTFPQEVRYDELGAVSYTKGCYTGQETVARVHFRGHPNRTLRGVALAGGRPAADRKVMHANKEVGLLRTALVLEHRVLALATLRREVSDSAALTADNREVRVIPLPMTQEVLV